MFVGSKTPFSRSFSFTSTALSTRLAQHARRQLMPYSVLMAKIDSVKDDGFRTIIREAKKNNSPKKLMKFAQQWSAEGRLTQNMTVTTIKTLQRMNRTEMSFDLIPYWEKSVDTEESFDIQSGVSLLKNLCRLRRIDLAELILEKAGIYPNEFLGDYDLNPTVLSISEALLPELAYGYTISNKYQRSLNTIKMMVKYSLPIHIDISKNIFKIFLKETDGQSIRTMLSYLLRIGGLSDNDSIQMLANTYMKSIEFKYGVVSMKTMPPETDMEAAFIGRSNVGKSSLINMITNRKGLAFTSKTPGKTSEFNFFEANARNTEQDDIKKFFLVDMPGVGYAQVTKTQRIGWLDVLRSYVIERRSLRVLFHLVDSRHGLLEADKECLELLEGLPERVQYVIVLTKADKRGGGARRDMIDNIKKELFLHTSRDIPIILTSSDSRTGGAVLWSVLLDSIAGDVPNSFNSLLPQPNT